MSYAFMPDALEANAAGQLTDAQHAMFAEGSFVMRLMPTVTGDLHKGAVAVVEGALRKKMPINVSQSPESSGMQLHALEVEGVDYEVPSRRVWDEVPTTGWVRLYYLPRSRVTVNLEILPDPAVDASPQDVVGTVRDVIGSALSPGVTKRSRIKRAERAAHAQAVVRSAMNGGTGPQTAPVSAVSGTATREDLVGSWTSMFFNVEVSGDGTLTINNAQGVRQPGRWMVDTQSQLHVQIDDEDDLVTPFMVADNQLTIQFAGQELTLQRAR